MKLHPKKGLNPHMLLCERCGEAYGIAVIGNEDKIYQCESCEVFYLAARSKKCPGCGKRSGRFVKELHDYEPIVNGLCKNCEEELKHLTDLVREGGLFFKCENCGSEGVIKPSDTTKELKRNCGYSESEPLGVTIPECPNCS